MPALVLPLVAFTIGVGLAWAGSEEIARAGGVALGTRSVVLTALLGLLVCAPIAAFFLSFHPDWCYAYVVDSVRLPGVIPSAFVLMCVVAPPVGFTLAAPLAAEHRLGRVLELGAVSTVAALIALLPGIHRLGVQATYQEYHGDFGVVPVAGSRLGLGLVWMLVVLVGAVVWTTTSVRRLSRDRTSA